MKIIPHLSRFFPWFFALVPTVTFATSVVTHTYMDLNTDVAAFERPAFTTSQADTLGLDCAALPWADFRRSVREYLFPGHDYTPLLHDREITPQGTIDWNLRSLWGIDNSVFHNGSYNFFYEGLIFDGEFRNLSFATEMWKGHFTGDGNDIYQSSMIDGYTKSEDDTTEVYLDNLTGRITLDGNWYRFEFGRNSFQTGSGISGSVILSDYANDYGYLENDLQLGKLKVITRHAELVADSMNSKEPEDRYLATHSFEWQTEALRVAVGENIVYANRGIDVNYLLPFGVWRVLEHNLHDRDNCMIFVSSDYTPAHSDVYFNFLLDEFSYSKLTTHWWANKYAVQLGYGYQWQAIPLRTVLEFVAVRPWTYTHYLPGDRFTHDGRSLGFSEGSNLIQFAGEANLRLSHRFSIDTWHAFKRQGSLGSDVFQNYNTRPKNSADWLEGEKTNTITDRLVFTYDYNGHHRFRAGIEAKTVGHAQTRFTLTTGWQTIF